MYFIIPIKTSGGIETEWKNRGKEEYQEKTAGLIRILCIAWGLYSNINDLDYRKEIIDTFVNSVFVYDDKQVLTYNYKDGTETLTLQEIESVLSSNLTSMCPPKK